MKNFYILLIPFFFFSLLIYSQESNTILSLNTGGHRSMIKDITITNDGKYLVSTGDDKVINIWKLESGTLEQELFGKCGKGDMGKIFCMALSPDNKFLAVGGALTDDKKKVVVRIYDFKKRRLKKLLRPVKDKDQFTFAMSFTSDSRFLLASTDNSEITAWDLTSNEVATTIYTPTYRALSIQIRDSLLLTASSDSSIMLWNLKNGREIKTFKNAHESLAASAIFSPDGKYIISIGFDQKINVYDNKLKLLNSTLTDINPTSIAFSPNGSKLLVGFWEPGAQHSQLYEFKNEKLELLVNFNEQKEEVMAVKFLNDSVAITAGGEDNDILFWTWKNGMNGTPASTKVIKRLAGKGRSIWGVAMTGHTIAFTTKQTDTLGASKPDATFNLLTHEIKPVSGSIKFAAPVHNYGEYSIVPAKGGSLGFNNADLIILKNGKENGRIKRDIYNGENCGLRHRCFTIVENKFIVSGGDNGSLEAYDFHGKLISILTGTNSKIRSVAVSSDGKYLLSGTSDQAIRIWKVDDIGRKRRLPFKSVSEIFNTPQWNNYFETIGITALTHEKTNQAWEKAIKLLKGLNHMPEAKTIEAFYKQKDKDVVDPVATIFISEDHEWAIWCKDGYYTGSQKGSFFVGQLVDNGFDKDASFYPLGQFDMKFNRPDIVIDRLAIADSNLTDIYRLAYKKKLAKMNIREESLSEDIHIPEVAITNNTKENNNVKLTLNISDDKYLLDRIFVTVNNVPLYGRKGLCLKDTSHDISRELVIPLQHGKNEISVTALNAKGTRSITRTVNVDHEQGKRNGKLYLISIGVSDYTNKAMNLDFPKKDASDIASLFSTHPGQYDSIYSDTIYNIEATLKNIAAIKQKLYNTNVDDQVVIFLAGHCVPDMNLNYYFGTHDVDFKDPSKNGLSYEALEGLLDSIPARNKVLMMQASLSGTLNKNAGYTTVVKSNSKTAELGNISGTIANSNTSSQQTSFELMKELFTDLQQSSGAIIISSAGAPENFTENAKWNNGVFTHCVLSGLKDGKADFNADGKIMVSELQQYLEREVPQLSKGTQNSLSRLDIVSNDWQLW